MQNTMDFDLDQAIEDFHFMTEWYGDKECEYEYYIRCAVQAQMDEPINEKLYKDCIQKLKTAIGGYQMRMEGIE